mmetsp:Transcript_72783/g.120506  ORF Transcript_72783/g.120506 Transcript_72783/m.120506 type:complete len:86 (-) Transcript_72783:761-1018(-)
MRLPTAEQIQEHDLGEPNMAWNTAVSHPSARHQASIFASEDPVGLLCRSSSAFRSEKMAAAARQKPQSTTKDHTEAWGQEVLISA